MSADPFNFGPPNQFPVNQPGGSSPGSPPGGPAPVSGTPGPASNPFGPVTQPAPIGGVSHAGPSSGGGPAASPSATLTVAKPPVWLLFLAAGLALTAGIVALVWGAPAVAIVCWFLAGPVAIGLLALFVLRDTSARASGLYAAPSWVQPMHYVAIGLCLMCILVPALRIADWVGRL